MTHIAIAGRAPLAEWSSQYDAPRPRHVQILATGVGPGNK